MADTKDLSIQQGKTFTLVIRWEVNPIVYKAITGISLAFGAPRLTVVGHGCPSGWRAAVTRVKSPKQINAENNPLKESDYHSVTVIDVDTVEFNDMVPCDDNGIEWPSYSDGGFFQYNSPVDITGYSARMKIKDKVGGTVLASTESEDAPLNVLSIALDAANKTITLSIAATDSDDFAWTKGVYDLEMVSPSGGVTEIMSGKVSVTKEVTT